MDVKIFGPVKIIDCSKTRQPPEYQTKHDKIHIFLNFKKVGEFSSKEDALKKLGELIKNSPENLELFIDYLKL